MLDDVRYGLFCDEQGEYRLGELGDAEVDLQDTAPTKGRPFCLPQGFNIGYHPSPEGTGRRSGQVNPMFVNQTLHKKLVKTLDKLDLIRYIYNS